MSVIGRNATIQDLAGRWATDPNYARAIAERAAEIWPDLPDQEDVTPMSAVPETIDYSSLSFPVVVELIPESQPNQNPGIAMTPQWVTIHETGSPNPATDSARSEANWVKGGADGQQLSVHFFVDAREAIQIMPLNRVAWHAGDGGQGPGNRTSLAIETVIEPNGLTQARANVRALAALLIRSLPSLQSPSATIGGIMVVQHNHWSGKNCPMICRQTAGCWDEQVRGIRELVNAPPPIWPHEPIPAPDEMRAQGHVLTVNASRRFACTQGGRFRTAPNRDAPAINKPPYRASRIYLFDYAADVDGEAWLVSKRGSWAPMQNFTEVA